ncbi:MAG: agmatine deiminase family protein [Tenuifilaceae bacterium]|jgi:agmatine/peptidylarginine deiminase|nr:agmatine deiminase family protein [Tenuifilaceae bacterium]
MISDNQTNTIYFSELLKSDEKYSAIYKEIESKLAASEIAPKLLPKTKDIWARDYMPIQVKDKKYIEFRYDPDYLQGNYKTQIGIKTYPDIVCDAINLKTIKTDVVLDGGNVVKSSNAVILTDKVITENQHHYNKTNLIKELKDIFDVEKIILIPQDPEDPYGHSDGMVRFIDENRVLLNGFYLAYPSFAKSIEDSLRTKGLTPEWLKFSKQTKDKRRWAYINFLQTKDIILLPKFGIDEDVEAIKQLEEHYPEYRNRIIQIQMDAVISKGGALNCISWTTKE